MSTSAVRLRLAFVWDCPACGNLNESPEEIKPVDEEELRRGALPDATREGRARRVTCRCCGEKFRTLPLS